MIGTMKLLGYCTRYLTVVVSAVLYCSGVTKGQGFHGRSIVAERPVLDASVPGEHPPAIERSSAIDRGPADELDPTDMTTFAAATVPFRFNDRNDAENYSTAANGSHERELKSKNSKKKKFSKSSEPVEPIVEPTIPSDIEIVEPTIPSDIEIYNEDSSNDERLENAIEAGQQVEGLIKGIRDGLNSPADVIQFVGQIADLVSIFVPQMSIVSAAFSLFGALVGEEEDQMMTALQGIEDEIQKLNERFDELITLIPIESCKQSSDDLYAAAIMPLRAAMRDIRDGNTGEKENGHRSLVEHCSPESAHRPAVAFGHIDNFIQSEGTVRDCHQRFVDSAKNRILYYRTTFVIPLMTKIHEVMEFEGICEGVRNNASLRSQGRLANDIRRFKDIFEAKEGPMPANWISSFQVMYDRTGATTAAVLADLKRNWSPSYKYRIFRITGQDDRWASRSGNSGLPEGSGAISVRRDDNGWMAVMWVGSKANPGGSVAWINQNCSGDSMCTRKRSERYCCHRPFPWIVCGRHCHRDVCENNNCGSTWRVATDHLSTNNPDLQTQMTARGAVYVHTGRRTWECIPNCGIPVSSCIEEEEEVLYDMNEEDITICNAVGIVNNCCGYGYANFNRVHDVVGDANVQRLRFREGDDFDYSVYVNQS